MSSLDLVANTLDKLSAHIEAIITKPDRLHIVLADQQFQFVSYLLWVALSPAPAPEAPLRTKGTLVGAPPAGKDSGEPAQNGKIVLVHG